jgi:hypothetical protein
LSAMPGTTEKSKVIASAVLIQNNPTQTIHNKQLHIRSDFERSKTNAEFFSLKQLRALASLREMFLSP